MAELGERRTEHLRLDRSLDLSVVLGLGRRSRLNGPNLDFDHGTNMMVDLPMRRLLSLFSIFESVRSSGLPCSDT